MTLLNALKQVINEATNVTFYHGTHYDNLLDIMKKGLLPQKPEHSSMAIKGVYITPYIETAARYAHGIDQKQPPLVLELRITKNRRLKKLIYDPMDRKDHAWNDHSYGDYDSNLDEVNYRINRQLQNLYDLISKKVGQKLHAPKIFSILDIDTFDDIPKLEGKSLFQLINKDLQTDLGQNFKPNQSWIKKEINKMLPDLANEYFDVTPTGTIQISNEYYSEKDQYVYPARVTPNQIKAIYVPKKDFPNLLGVTETEIGQKLLPNEARNRLDDLTVLISEIEDAIKNTLTVKKNLKKRTDFKLLYNRLLIYRQTAISLFDPELKTAIEKTLIAIKKENKKAVIASLKDLEDEIEGARFAIDDEWAQETVVDHKPYIRLDISKERNKTIALLFTPPEEKNQLFLF